MTLVSCRHSEGSASTSDVRPFTSFAGVAILCLNLRDDVGLRTGALLLRVDTATPAGRRDVVLPLRTRDVTPSRNVLLASGSYDDFTVISMSMGGASLGASAVSFVPITRGIDLSRPMLGDLEPGLYYQENGLERWVVFVDGSAAVLDQLRRDFPSTVFETYDAVAIAIPDEAEGREVVRGRTVDPAPNHRFGNTMLFERASVMSSKRVALRYIVPPSAIQSALSNNALKLVLIAFIPILTLLYLEPNEIQRPRLRLAAIWGGVALQACFVGIVLWAAVTIRAPSPDAWVDFVLATIGVVGEAIIILVKAKPRRKAG